MLFTTLSLLTLGCVTSANHSVQDSAQETVHDIVTVWSSGEGGYHTFRIPALVVAGSGDLVAIAEGRKGGRGDSGDIDLVTKRSTDGGATWSELSVIWDDGANTCGNPCVVLDRVTGELHLLATHNLGQDREHEIIAGTSEGTRTVWTLRSEDHGRTWSEPRALGAAVKLPSWTWYATGPGAGIQLERAEHAGRLVIPCDHIEAESKRYLSHIIYSDDHGASWELGGSSPQDQVNECEIAELTDGRLLLNMRNYDREQHTRQVAYSSDGGASFENQAHDTALIEPICQASLRRVSWPTGETPGVLAFSNPASEEARVNMTVRYSYDDGQTWPESTQLYEGSSAYSCLARLGEGELACLFEVEEYGRIVFAKLRAPDSTSAAAPDEPLWFADFDKALQAAERQDKDLFVAFISSDGHEWSSKLRTEVLEQDTFLAATKRDYVLVSIDFPAGDEAKALVPSPERNAALKVKYAIRGYPAVMLMTSEGEAYASVAYRPGGPSPFVASMARERSKGRAALTEIKRLIESFEAAKADDKLAAWEQVMDKLEGMPPLSPLIGVFVEPARWALEADPTNEHGLKLRAVQSLLATGWADAALIGAGRELDPRNELGLLEQAVWAQVSRVDDEASIRAARAELDALSTFGFRDKELGFKLNFTMCRLCLDPLGDKEGVQKYGKAAKSIGTPHQSLLDFLDRVMNS